MKRKRGTLLALVCALVMTNAVVIFAASYETVDKFSDDYSGNIKGYVSSLIVDSGWFKHRGRSYVALTGSDKEYLSKSYAATSSVGDLESLGRKNVYSVVKSYDECTDHGWFSSVTTTLKTDNSKVSITARD